MWEGAFTWASIAAGALAAGLWYRSTQISFRKRRVDIRPEEYSVWLHTDNPDVMEQPFLTAKAQSKANALAAGVTALAILLQAASLIAHRYGW